MSLKITFLTCPLNIQFDHWVVMMFYLKEKTVLFPQSCLGSCTYECWRFVEDCAQSQCWAEHRQCLLFSRLCVHKRNLFLAGYHVRAEILALLMTLAISPRSPSEGFYDRTQIKIYKMGNWSAWTGWQRIENPVLCKLDRDLDRTVIFPEALFTRNNF